MQDFCCRMPWQLHWSVHILHYWPRMRHEEHVYTTMLRHFGTEQCILGPFEKWPIDVNWYLVVWKPSRNKYSHIFFSVQNHQVKWIWFIVFGCITHIPSFVFYRLVKSKTIDPILTKTPNVLGS